MIDPEENSFRPPVKVATLLERRGSGEFQVGVRFDDTSWVWTKLKARRKDTAAKEAPQAIALLIDADRVRKAGK